MSSPAPPPEPLQSENEMRCWTESSLGSCSSLTWLVSATGHSLTISLTLSTEDITPLRFEDVDWDAWDDISPGDLGEDELDDDLSERVTRISLSDSHISSPWANLAVDPLVAAEERALRLGYTRELQASRLRRLLWSAYGRLHYLATTMQVCGFKYNSYQGYDTLEEARSHWMHALATGTWGDPRRGGDRSIPPFEGYHIVYDSSVDPTAIPLSEAMKSTDATSTTSSSSSSTIGYSSAPSSPVFEAKRSLTPRLHFPSIPSGSSILSNMPSLTNTEAKHHEHSRSFANRHESSAKGKTPARSPNPSLPQAQGIPSKARHSAHFSSPGPSSLRSPTGSQARLHRYDLPPSRELTPKDKYYVVQIGLQPGVYKGEAEARRHMGTSRLAFAHIEATRKVANARYLSLVESREVFEAI
ncbi:hypothetical protein BKA70DRAFT_1450931 [Coprinopsis sp. MPI-PUGE-AT-0042]|nr:hypothetical protein BKA70DRAFT_1450931 [Coprinopsis sp. MPI-PUGE-AT-0042]